MAASPPSDGAPQAGSTQPSSSRDTMASNTTTEPTSLTMEVLRKITNNFSEDRAIGQGSYGKVYRGVHDNGEEIAVKLLYNNMQAIGDEQFRHEFHNLMMLKHQNIVRLVGYCYETQHQHMEFEGRIIFGDVTSKALCFEYMHKGSLQKHISDECHGLDWHTRYKIIKGTCEGLKYLHEGFKDPLYHLDLKPDNILLDENMVPKLADFGLSKFFSEGKTRVTQSLIGTIGYMPPEYIHLHLVSRKLDIFSLGVVMIEIIAGPRGHSRSAEMPYQEFIDQVHPNWRNRLEATRSSPGPLEAYCEQVNICIEIALSCIGPDRRERPNIVDIIHKLNETETVIDKALSLSGSSRSWMPGDLVKVQAFTRSRAIQGSTNLASGLDDANQPFPYLPTVLEEPSSSVSEAAEDDPLPAIDGLRITGEAFPGRELQASGYSINGTTSCNFEWVRHWEDGSVNFIDGARQPTYLVTADDVDSLLAIEVQPLDDRKRKGDIVKVYSNEQRKITCDPETKELIKKILSIGHVSYEVLLSVKFLDMWEPAVLAIKREGYSIKCNGQRGAVIIEKFQQATAINIPCEHPTEFSIQSADGAKYNLKPAENAPSRDTIVLILRLFRMKAVEMSKRKKGFFF